MKKTKILTLVATLLVVATILCSCGTISSFNKFSNKKFVPTNEVYTEQSTITELLGYSIVEANEEFIIFRSSDLLNLNYKIFSIKTSKVIANIGDTASIFDFELYEGAPLVTVAKATKPIATTPDEPVPDAVNDTTTDTLPAPDDTESETEEDISDIIQTLSDVSYTTYDADGNVVKATSHKPEAPSVFNYNVCVFDYVSYSINDNGTLTENAEIPEYVLVDNITYANDKFYYVMDSKQIAVYDTDFNFVSVWCAPSYCNQTSSFVLNNGDILVQYTYEVDSDQKKFDISSFDGNYARKLELVSLIVDAKKGSAKEIELDYLVCNVKTNESLNKYYDINEKTSPYTEKFENIAVIAPIVNKNVDVSDASLDIVFMNNKAKAKDSLKIVDNQVADPFAISKIGENLFVIDTLTGSVVTNAKGRIIERLNTHLDVCGQYLVGKRAIYNFNFESVCNLVKSNAEVIACIDNTVFVKANSSSGYSIVTFANGEKETVFTFFKDTPTSGTFEIIEGIGYYIYDPNTKEYKYYNSQNDLLMTTTYKLEIIVNSTANDTVIFGGLNGEQAFYHTFYVKDIEN